MDMHLRGVGSSVRKSLVDASVQEGSDFRFMRSRQNMCTLQHGFSIRLTVAKHCQFD